MHGLSKVILRRFFKRRRLLAVALDIAGARKRSFVRQWKIGQIGGYIWPISRNQDQTEPWKNFSRENSPIFPRRLSQMTVPSRGNLRSEKFASQRAVFGKLC